MDVHFLDSIDDCPADQWDALAPPGYPFTRHAFLAALERSGSASEDSGWIPLHAVAKEGGEAIAALPLYLKDHSYGEYVFDWNWANAFHRHGIPYYPKLITAIPFTPATGPRLLCQPGREQDILPALLDAIAAKAAEIDASSWHLLFPQAPLKEALAESGLAIRCGVQYHWHNRDYQNFDDFLAQCSSRKRKNLRKERRRAHEQGITLHQFQGDAINDELWQHFHRFYQLTYAKRSGHGGYLKHGFFEDIGRTMADQLLLVMAQREGRWIAGALNFIGDDTLYGRYWGCIEEWDMLHFEACYYQGIDYCIANGLSRFDPGAQGEHKIQRGFEPTLTWSSHLIRHPEFKRAIEQFVEAEHRELLVYQQQAARLLPFRRDD